MNIENILNKAEVFYQNKAFIEAIELCNKLLLKKSNLIRARQILALSYQGINDIDSAIREFNTALSLSPSNANILNNFGQLYIVIQDFKIAASYFKKAIAVDNSFGAAYNNLGVCQQQFGEFDEAEKNIKKAILHEGACAEFYLNLGALYLEVGNFEHSMSMFMKSLELDPTQKSIYHHISTLMMYMHQYQDALEAADIGIASSHLPDIDLCELLVGKATLFWLFDNLEEAAQAIQLSHGVYIDKTNYPNIRNLTIFHKYLQQLVNYRMEYSKLYDHQIEKPIYFISESHGFAPSGMKVTDESEELIVKSLFIRGAKVFHFTGDKHNKFKESLLRLFNGLEVKSKIILGFGEIDCRNNEGIFKYSNKYQKNYIDVIDKMVNAYLSFLLTHNKKQHQIYIYGVPAPHPQRFNILNNEEIVIYKKIVEYFNLAMNKACTQYGIKFLDVYQLTNTKGESNLEYHLDDIHLIPPTIIELFNAYS